MDEWVIWLIVAVVFGIGEIATLRFFLAPFAGGALVAAVVSGAGGGDGAELGRLPRRLGRAARRAAAGRAARTCARRRRLRTGTAALVGRTATVVERVGSDEGCVRLDGEIWTARPYDEDQVFEAGKRVQVLEIRGATALVAE